MSIPEQDFQANEKRRLRELAGLLLLCGESPLQISRGCGLDKRTVIRAREGKPIRSDAQARIEFYLKTLLQSVPDERHE
jgi:hypothetical protein